MRVSPRSLSGYELSLVFGVCLAAVLVLNLSLIAMPPVWDAVGVFAPAIFLYESGLDLPALLASPGYLEAGPNIHSLSLITFVTLAAIGLAGGEPALYIPALHVLNFGLAAVVVTGTFAVARRFVGFQSAVLVALALLLFPLFLVQTGMLHTEIAGAALVITALLAFARRRFITMTALVVTACLVKSFGVALVVGLGALLLCDLGMSIRQRLCWLAAMAVPAVAIESAKLATAYTAIGPPHSRSRPSKPARATSSKMRTEGSRPLV